MMRKSLKPQRRPSTKFWFRQYHFSETVAQLKNNLNAKVIRQENSVYRKKPGHVLINWGSTKPFHATFDLNKPEFVAIAAHKLETFRVLQAAGVPIPQWTDNKEDAAKWNTKVVARDTATGRAGAGITIYKKNEKIENHLFYSSYFKKKREFRIHVFRGQIIFEQEKLKKKGVENADKYIRSHDRGWCFAFNHLLDSPVPIEVRSAAANAVAAIGLDFGAVDVGWHDDNGACVFEVNTAPGLEASSLDAYKKAIEHFYWEIIEGGPA